VPDPDPTKTILGEVQWKWLEERLKEPADLRIIGSSIQFSHEYNGWESWTNFPRELLKMVDLIKSTKGQRRRLHQRRRALGRTVCAASAGLLSDL
jgi:alkaline phosphatase D